MIDTDEATCLDCKVTTDDRVWADQQGSLCPATGKLHDWQAPEPDGPDPDFAYKYAKENPDEQR